MQFKERVRKIKILEKKHKYCYILRSYSEALESALCDVIKIRLLSISFLVVSFPTFPVIPPFKNYIYDVTHDTFQRFSCSTKIYLEFLEHNHEPKSNNDIYFFKCKPCSSKLWIPFTDGIL